MSSEEDSSPVSGGTDDIAALPTDAAGWREVVARLPVKDVLRLIQQDKGRATKVLAGFRPNGAAVRHPVVLSRIAEEATKQPKFAEALGEVVTAFRKESSAEETAPVAPPSPAPAPPSPKETIEAEFPLLKETLKKQRSALREKDTRIAELEEMVTTLRRERDTARTESETAQAARRTAEEGAERQRRLRDRESRRLSAPVPTTSEGETGQRSRTKATAPVEIPLPPPQKPFEEAARRLISRGKYSLVAEICREALLTEAATINSIGRGVAHLLLAAALYGLGDAQGEEQDRLAVTALLDGGDVIQATEAMARLLTQATTIRQSDGALLRRLLLLAERTNQAPLIQEAFTRMRIGSPEAYRRLRQIQVSGGRKMGSLLDTMAASTAAESGPQLTADQPLALPTSYAPAAIVTPRHLARAVDESDEEFVHAVRAGLALLRQRGGQESDLANAFLEAVTAVEPVAVAPLLASITNPVVVDASNVARHNPDPLALSPPPRVTNLLQMRDFLLRRGFFPVLLIADATLRFYMDDRAGYQALIDRHIIRETPPGTSADEVLIQEARLRAAPLITNDRLAEWGDSARRVERLSFLISQNRVTLTPT